MKSAKKAHQTTYYLSAKEKAKEEGESEGEKIFGV